MKKLKKIFKSKKILKLLFFIVGFGLTTVAMLYVYADTLFASNIILYDNSDSSLSSTNVQGAIDELYGICNAVPISEYITNLYDSNIGTVTTVTTAGGETIYQVSSEGLMKDSFGNIRYYGASPNNYVTFNGESAGWRIIGVFYVDDGNENVEKRVKIIRDTSIGSFSWDNKASGVGTSTSDDGSNDWTDSRLMMTLNGGYENTYQTNSSLYGTEASLYWNSKSGTCYSGSSSATVSCDFTSTGLTDEGKAMLDPAKYYLGGIPYYSDLYADDYYKYEIGITVYSGHATEWTGYMALMYPSDYAYAADLSLCTESGYNYYNDTTNCTGTDWLFSGNVEWTLSPRSNLDYHLYNVWSNGRLSCVYPRYQETIRPVGFLTSQVSIVAGSGTSSDPYILR